jgi:hypothetical protein
MACPARVGNVRGIYCAAQPDARSESILETHRPDIIEHSIV